VATVERAQDRVSILDDIPVDVDVPMVMAAVKSNGANKRVEANVAELIELVKPIVRPKVIYRTAQVTMADGKRLEIEGTAFTHHVASLNFARGERVFPYVATCGVEIEKVKFPDLLKDYCLNVLKNVILMRAAGKYFEEHLKTKYNLQEVSRMGPGEAMGSTAQQRGLFSLLGDVEGGIGVKLSPHNMMVPEKSTSGIYFETAVKIESCQLCPNPCPNRRGPYDPELFKTFRKKG
jgi:hypothetical protein